MSAAGRRALANSRRCRFPAGRTPRRDWEVVQVDSQGGIERHNGAVAVAEDGEPIGSTAMVRLPLEDLVGFEVGPECRAGR